MWKSFNILKLNCELHQGRIHSVYSVLRLFVYKCFCASSNLFVFYLFRLFETKKFFIDPENNFRFKIFGELIEKGLESSSCVSTTICFEDCMDKFGNSHYV